MGIVEDIEKMLEFQIKNFGRKRWQAQFPVYAPEQIPFLVDVMTENIIYSGGDLSTAEWSISHAYLDYGYYQLVVTYY